MINEYTGQYKGEAVKIVKYFSEAEVPQRVLIENETGFKKAVPINEVHFCQT